MVSYSIRNNLLSEHPEAQYELADLRDADSRGGEVHVPRRDGPGVPQSHRVGSGHQGHHRQAVELEDHADIF